MELDVAKSSKRMYSPGIKLLLLCVMAIALIIPQFFIDFLVDSRRNYSSAVQESIAQSWGGRQNVRPIWLAIPVKTSSDSKQVSTAYYQPDSVRMFVDMQTQTRTRGFYSAVLYHAKIRVEGYLNPKSFDVQCTRDELEQDGDEEDGDLYLLKNAYLATTIENTIGLKSNLVVEMGGKSYNMFGTTERSSLFYGKEFIAPINLLKDSLGHFSYTYELNGYQDLEFFVQSNSMDVQVALHYPTPAFSGDYLPDEYTITDSLTMAHWRIFSNASSFPRLINSKKDYEYYAYEYDEDKKLQCSFVVSTQVTDVYYRAIERSLKYAILIIIFTFLTFFFTDTLAKTNMPMIGYLLTGCAILLFYTLLLSISEYLPFGWAYLITSVAIIAMIGVYFWSFIRALKPTLLCVGILVILYTFLYLILQMDTFPLLVGSIFLFIVLGIVMYLSRKLTW